MSDKPANDEQNVTVRLEAPTPEEIESYGALALYGYRTAVRDIGMIVIVAMIWYVYLMRE